MDNNLIFIKVRKKIEEDVAKIEDMISAYLSAKGSCACPLYQDVIDTQIYGLSKEISLAVEIGCLSNDAGRKILNELEQKAAAIYVDETAQSKAN